MAQDLLNSDFMKKLISKELTKDEFYTFLDNDKLYCLKVSEIL